MVLLVANFGPAGLGYAADRAPLNLLVAAAGFSILVVLLFPWLRYDRNVFLVVAVGGKSLIALAVRFSGGWASPFFPLYFFVVVFAAIYFTPRVAAAVVFLTALASVSPQIYAPDAARLAPSTRWWASPPTWPSSPATWRARWARGSASGGSTSASSGRSAIRRSASAESPSRTA